MGIKIGTVDVILPPSIAAVYVGANKVYPAPKPFIIMVKTDNAGTSANNEMYLPIYGTGMTVKTSEGTTVVNGPTTVSWPASGGYEVEITGMDYIQFLNGGDRLKLLTIEQWGTRPFTTMSYAFMGCSNMTGNYTDTADTTNVTTMYQMFYGCSSFNQAVAFDTTNVTNMSNMFYNCTLFNQAVAFVTTNVNTMYRMFYGCSSFNQAVAFDTTNVTTMYQMFYNCTLFNQALAFVTTNVTTMYRMLEGCPNFDQDLSLWDVSLVASFFNFMTGVTLSTANYDALLIAWNALDLVNDLSVHFGSSKYTALGEAAKNQIIADDNWSFTDGGLETPSYLTVIEDGNTVAWYDSSDLATITKDGSNFVSAWNDKLGSGHDLLQATGARQPTWLDGNGIYFPGNASPFATDGVFLKTASFTLSQPEFIYIVFKQINRLFNGLGIFDGNSQTSGALNQGGNVTYGLIANAGNGSDPNLNLPFNTFGIARILFYGNSSKLQINETTSITGTFGTASMSGFTLGARGANNWFSRIQVKEIIIRKVSDVAQDEQDIYDYLSTKYSI